MNLYRRYFDLVAAGRKTIEVRVQYPNLRSLKAGDHIRFVCGPHGALTRVKRVARYTRRIYGPEKGTLSQKPRILRSGPAEQVCTCRAWKARVGVRQASDQILRNVFTENFSAVGKCRDQHTYPDKTHKFVHALGNSTDGNYSRFVVTFFTSSL
jgi:hypothetical protein